MQLGAAGATVYCTGRTTRSQRSETNRPETIEETAALVDAAGGRGIAVQVDHLVPEQVSALVARIADERGALHVLVNDIWGLTRMEWSKSVWESDLEAGLHLLHLAVDTHAITSHFALPLLIETPGGLVVEVTDGTDEYNLRNYRVSFFYDLAKAAVNRMAFALAHELRPRGATAVSLTPGWLRSGAMLAMPTRHGVELARGDEAQAHFAISESPVYVGRAVAALAQDPDVARWNATRCRADSWRKSTASRTSTAADRTRGATSSKCKTPANRPTSPAIADAERDRAERECGRPRGPHPPS